MRKKFKDFNPFLYKLINLNKKIEFIFLNYKNIKLANSLSFDDIFLSYLLLSKRKYVDIFLLNTGRLFISSINIIKKIMNKYKYSLNVYHPNFFLINKYISKYTLNGFYNNIILRKICCHIRKINLLNIIIKNSCIWISGQRKNQSTNRYDYIYEYEYDNLRNLIKCNLLLNWDDKDVFYFIEKFNIINNYIYNLGYYSIGCEPCTKPIYRNNNLRDGRWWWEINSKKECGIHE